eukprot:TRINITY_DN8713_c0_g1_i3.p1 TRINITY_DN8713_c0_g1~~TRINITY_DN8713_c0_g1_i3.p1  ORF type:complete len:247 (+),score=44.84 TRINITY_DN8713_c0_g1_i3:67-807(+)
MKVVVLLVLLSCVVEAEEELEIKQCRLNNCTVAEYLGDDVNLAIKSGLNFGGQFQLCYGFGCGPKKFGKPTLKVTTVGVPKPSVNVVPKPVQKPKPNFVPIPVEKPDFNVDLVPNKVTVEFPVVPVTKAVPVPTTITVQKPVPTPVEVPIGKPTVVPGGKTTVTVPVPQVQVEFDGHRRKMLEVQHAMCQDAEEFVLELDPCCEEYEVQQDEDICNLAEKYDFDCELLKLINDVDEVKEGDTIQIC